MKGTGSQWKFLSFPLSSKKAVFKGPSSLALYFSMCGMSSPFSPHFVHTFIELFHLNAMCCQKRFLFFWSFFRPNRIIASFGTYSLSPFAELLQTREWIEFNDRNISTSRQGKKEKPHFCPNNFGLICTFKRTTCCWTIRLALAVGFSYCRRIPDIPFICIFFYGPHHEDSDEKSIKTKKVFLQTCLPGQKATGSGEILRRHFAVW